MMLLMCVIMSINAKQVSANDISEYVYPKNITKSPNKFSYMPDGKSYLSLSDDRKLVLKYDTEKGILLDTLLNVDKTRETKIDKIEGFTMSPDGSKLLIYNDIQFIYRRSFDASYYVYELRSNILRPISKKFERQRAPLFSNDGRMIAFVAENNIYVYKTDYNSEIAVTTDGCRNKIIYGVPDWTYEEEFMVHSSMVWSSDNLTLCYVKYDESNVNSYSFPLYGGVCKPNHKYELYPGEYVYKYPKAGTQNSKVTVYSYDVETRKIKHIKLNDSDVEYIPRIASINGDSHKIIIATLNRQQNKLRFLLTDPKTTITTPIYVDNARAWINEICYNNAKFYSDCFIVSSAHSGFNHLYKYSYTGGLLEQITSGDYDVLDYYGKDDNENHYYQSTKSGAINRVVTRIDKKGKEVDLSPAQGCASAFFSPLMNYYVINHSNVSTPPVYKLYKGSHKEIKTLEDNIHIAKKYELAPKREFIEITTDDAILNAYIIKPKDFNSSNKYPVIMTMYNGPSSQSVLNRWTIDWENHYAMEGYVIVCVDGRGTGGRGQNFQNVVYKNLGYYETLDQIAAAKYISSLPYIDGARMGLHGWSYGGYETIMAISHPDAPYKAAVAVAPVTDWRFYDTAYTERYMLTPNENEDGYETSSTMNKVTYVNCHLLIMSGTADDNVHLSNTMEYVSHLIANGKHCDMFLFPNMNHSINGCNSRTMVYTKMLDYFDTYLKQ